MVEKVMKSLSFALWLLVVLPLQAFSSEYDQLTQDVQAALIDYGYQPGAADGLLGQKTEQAIRKFQTDFRLKVDGRVSASLATDLGVGANQGFLKTSISVLSENSSIVAARLAGKPHIDVVNSLAELRAENRRRIDTKIDRPKAVVFEVYGVLVPGDIVHTQIEVIRADLPKFFENTYYEISEQTPRSPFVVINDVEAGWELQITHRLYHNGVLLTSKRTRAVE